MNLELLLTSSGILVAIADPPAGASRSPGADRHRKRPGQLARGPIGLDQPVGHANANGCSQDITGSVVNTVQRCSSGSTPSRVWPRRGGHLSYARTLDRGAHGPDLPRMPQRHRGVLFALLLTAAASPPEVQHVPPEQAIALAFVKIELGASMGFSAAEAMTGIDFVQGRLAVGAQLRGARMQRAGFGELLKPEWVASVQRGG